MRSNIVNVLDLELTCEQDETPTVRDVIEIGLCMVDLRSSTIVKTVSIPVWPERAPLTAYCSALTGWTLEKLKRQGAVSFAEACRRLEAKYASRNRLLVTDSFGDRQIIQERCEELGLPLPLGDGQFNVSTWYQIATGNRKNAGLDAMLATFGLTFEGQRHRASCDAFNIARLFLALRACSRVRQD